MPLKLAEITFNAKVWRTKMVRKESYCICPWLTKAAWMPDLMDRVNQRRIKTAMSVLAILQCAIFPARTTMQFTEQSIWAMTRRCKHFSAQWKRTASKWALIPCRPWTFGSRFLDCTTCPSIAGRMTLARNRATSSGRSICNKSLRTTSAMCKFTISRKGQALFEPCLLAAGGSRLTCLTSCWTPTKFNAPPSAQAVVITSLRCGCCAMTHSPRPARRMRSILVIDANFLIQSPAGAAISQRLHLIAGWQHRIAHRCSPSLNA